MHGLVQRSGSIIPLSDVGWLVATESFQLGMHSMITGKEVLLAGKHGTAWNKGVRC